MGGVQILGKWWEARPFCKKTLSITQDRWDRYERNKTSDERKEETYKLRILKEWMWWICTCRWSGLVASEVEDFNFVQSNTWIALCSSLVIWSELYQKSGLRIYWLRRKNGADVFNHLCWEYCWQEDANNSHDLVVDSRYRKRNIKNRD